MKTVKPDTIVYIAGIGALGSVLAASFCRSDYPIHLLLKKHQLSSYNESELTMINGDEKYSCYPPAMDIADINEPIDFLVCCVKAYDITTLLMRLKNSLHQHSIIILIHNGLGIVDEIKMQLPQLRIISGICTIGAYLEEPFTVHAFLEGKVHLGRVLGQFKAQEVEFISTAFQQANLPYQWEDDIETMMWEKFALNCSINILTALFNCKNGDLLLHGELLEKMTDEIAQVISAYGMSISGKDLYIKVIQLLKRVGNNYSSTYKDMQHKRRTELPYLNGHLIKLAQQKKIPTPVNIELWNQFSTRK
jgi:2-dehydropantoate 2-reductase